MKTIFELSVIISPEEEDTLQQAGTILKKICHIFDEQGQCKLCPLKDICDRLGNTMTPSSVIYAATDALTVEEEE